MARTAGLQRYVESCGSPALETAMMRSAWLLGGLLLGGCAGATAGPPEEQVFTTEQASFRVVEVAGGLEHPWGLAFLPDGRMLVTERPGRLRIVEDGYLLPEPVAGLPEVYVGGQGGLLDVALDPAFAENGLVYLSYAHDNEAGRTTRVLRGRLDDQALRGTQVIFEGLPRTSGSNHFGSRLAFGPDGMLYVTMGERMEMDRAQDLSQHPGKLVRIAPDGSVPPDNPFIGREDARPEIFTYGHRNAQGLAVRPGTGEIWLHEHGPQGGDEVNLIRAGANYGWPVITYGRAYFTGFAIGEGTEKPGMEQPVHYWVPSIAPSGMAFYRGAAFPKWQGDLFVGALRAELLVRLEMDGDRIVAEERLLEGELGRIRDVRSGPDGFLYLLTDEDPGGLYRLEPAD
jgi:glucose/arabinose dehydrogenase